jgi:biopolymer transport protein ExbB
MSGNVYFLVEFFKKGGIFMYPILLCSVVALSLFLYKLWSMRAKNILPEPYLVDLYGLINQGRLAEAAAISRRDGSSISRIAIAALTNNSRSKEELREEVEEAGRKEAQELGRYIEGLGAISNVSTLLGLLGTISGMIKIFDVIAREPIVNQQTLAGGISEALYTTAFGLCVAIPTYLGYKYYSEKLDEFVTNLELESRRIVEQITAAMASKEQKAVLEGDINI